MRWEEGKKWQAKLEKVKNSVKEKERENDSLSKQLSTLKDLYARSVYSALCFTPVGTRDCQLKDATFSFK